MAPLKMSSEFPNALFQSLGNYDSQNVPIPSALRRDPGRIDSSTAPNKFRAKTIRTTQLILDGVLRDGRTWRGRKERLWRRTKCDFLYKYIYPAGWPIFCCLVIGVCNKG